MESLLSMHRKMTGEYELKLQKLRNPWISVEERLPEEHSKVLIMFCNGAVTYNDYIGVGDINCMKAHSKTITHWMPIPELNKE
jgi:formamidopyrimidine-DNA glycosylase